MEIINETIKKVAELKANAAREAAEEVSIGGVVFGEGILPGEIEIKEGFDLFCAVLKPERVHFGYVGRNFDLAVRVYWAEIFGVKFYGRDYVHAADIPEDTKMFESREELYASV